MQVLQGGIKAFDEKYPFMVKGSESFLDAEFPSEVYMGKTKEKRGREKERKIEKDRERARQSPRDRQTDRQREMTRQKLPCNSSWR